METAMKGLFLALHNTSPEEWVSLLIYNEYDLIKKEKEQIKNAYDAGSSFKGDWEAEELYYKETYKK
jgi:hypothetical protein